MEGPRFEKPHKFDTSHDPILRGHFELYNGSEAFVNGEPQFDHVREEIAEYYTVPYTDEEDENSKKENHLFIVDNAQVGNQRHHRAFCVLIREHEGKRDAWYIDGRLPHVTLLRRLYNYYQVPDDDGNEIHLGFLDNDGFPDVEEKQEKSKAQGKIITWFVRDKVTPTK